MADTGVLFWLSFVFYLSTAAASDLARGWGDEISWVTLEDGLKQVQELDKPMMLLIHKTWCGACKALKPKFAEDKPIGDLSSKFIMVHTQDDEEPQGEQYTPDGGYIPRILFLDSKGIMKEYYNEAGSDKYKYYYPSTAHIGDSMKRVLDGWSKQKVDSSGNKKPTDEL